VRINCLAAVILADGSIDKKRYTVSFTEAKELVERLVQDFKKIDNLEVKWKVEPQGKSVRARAYSKVLTNLLLERIGISRTRPFNKFPFNPENKTSEIPQPKIPRECFENLEEAREFLRYYASCDGGPEFSSYKRSSGQLQIDMGIKIGCTNPYLKEQLGRLLQKFKINFRKVADGIEISRAEDLSKFDKEIRFLEESKVRKSKRFDGFLKNDVIKLFLICSLLSKNGNWINKNFKSVKKLDNFLKETLILIKEKDKESLKKLLKIKLKKEINVDSLF
jgi:hypothetical protein